MKKLLLLLFFFIPSMNFSQTFVQLVEKNDLQLIKQAIQNGEYINQVDDHGFTALHIAAWNGYADIVSFLLESGADPSIVSKSGSTPLRFATTETRAILLKYNKPQSPKTVPRLIHSTNVYTTNTSVVTNHIRRHDYPKLSYDILTNLTPEQSAELHDWDSDGNNNLHRAAKSGNLSEIKRLISLGINPKAVNTLGDSALRFATENNHLDVVKFLLEEVGLEVNAVNRNGTSALITATFNENPRMIQYLTHMGANINQTSMADVTRTVNNEEQEFTVDGFTALMSASQYGHNKTILALLNSGADINAVDSDNWNALMFAVQNGHLDTAQLLINKGINYNIESSDFWTAMSLARLNGDDEMVALLSNVNAMSSSVPLMTFEDHYYENDEYYYYDDDEDN